MRRRSAAAGLVVLLAAGAGCSAPKAPVKVGVREVPTDVLIGTREGGSTTTTVAAASGVPTPAPGSP